MKHTVYKITNRINNKIYIGVHQTKDLEDDYFGSGLIITRAVEKYGVNNFNKELLFIYDNSEEMFAKEAELVNEEFIDRKDTYNLKLGGFGGWEYVNSNRVYSEDGIIKRNFALSQSQRIQRERCADDLNYKENRTRRYEKLSAIGRAQLDELFPNGTFFRKTHSEETKKKLVTHTRIISTNKVQKTLNMGLVGCILWKRSVPKRLRKKSLNPH